MTKIINIATNKVSLLSKINIIIMIAKFRLVQNKGKVMQIVPKSDLGTWRNF